MNGLRILHLVISVQARFNVLSMAPAVTDVFDSFNFIYGIQGNTPRGNRHSGHQIKECE